jgi:hypothetical protein
MKIETEVSLERIGDLLCSAFEGGSNYWYRIEKFVPPPGGVSYSWGQGLGGGKIFRHISYPLSEGGGLFVTDIPDGDEGELPRKGKLLDLNALRSGLAVMANGYPRHYADVLTENDDATTGDVFLQCCLFGRVVYG